MGRAPCCEKVGLKRGRWTAEEDEILVKYIQANGEGSWRSLPKNAGLLRCGKSCRLRWINYLRADLKRGNISGEEEEVIIKLHGSYGNRWSLIASHIPGRTDNEIKNYWNSHLSRRIHTFKKADNEAVTVVMDMGRPAGGRKRRGGRTSRSAMKKNSGVPSNNVQHMIRKDKQQQDPPNFPVEASVVSDKSGGAYDSSVWISPSGMRMTEGRSESPFSDISYEAFESESLWFGLASSTELESEITVSPAMAVDGNCSTNTTAGSGIDGVVSLTGGERQSTATTTHEDDHQWLYSALEDDEWINMDWDWNQGVADDKTVPREEEGWERWSWLWDTVDDNLQDTTKESELEKSYAAWLLSSDVNRL